MKKTLCVLSILILIFVVYRALTADKKMHNKEGTETEIVLFKIESKITHHQLPEEIKAKDDPPFQIKDAVNITPYYGK